MLSALIVLGAVSSQKVKRGEYAKGSATIFCDDGFRNILNEELKYLNSHIPNHPSSLSS